MKNVKHWTESKTIKFNAIMIIGLLLDLAAKLIPAFEPVLNADTMKIYIFIVTTGNIVLRFLTNKGIVTDVEKIRNDQDA